jgi:hypothetical protein
MGIYTRLTAFEFLVHCMRSLVVVFIAPFPSGSDVAARCRLAFTHVNVTKLHVFT